MSNMMLKWLRDEYWRHLKTRLRACFGNSELYPNKRFHGCHKGERCFLLGSGPSIKGEDLTRLSGQVVMTQNNFHVHEQIAAISPRYHVLVPMYQPSEFNGDWQELFCTMDQRLSKDTICFFGVNSKQLLERHSLFMHRRFYVDSGYSVAVSERANIDITKPIYAIPTVLLQMLAIALYMQFQEIVLIGFDLNQVCLMHDRATVRFYGHSPITRNQAEIAAEKHLATTGLDWINMWVIWRQCYALKMRAKAQSTQIFNATRGGLLDMFERRDLSGLL